MVANSTCTHGAQRIYFAAMLDLDFDRHHLWHPYTSMDAPLPVYPVVGAEGVYLELENGHRLVDGMSSWWSVIHGYRHPVLIQALTDQAQRLAHVMFGGLTHEPAITLGQQLVQLTPPGLEKIFLCDSGSVSVEVALKMAMQYWLARGQPQKHRIATLRKGYHGDTFAAMSVCDPITGMHHLFRPVLMDQVFIPEPQTPFGEKPPAAELATLEQVLATQHGSLAALILEPIVQGAGRMYFYSADYLRQARALCDRYQVLLIADEIATGFGRSGKLFACEHAGISPDILCLGKALTGGTLTLAATLCTEEVAQTISRDGGVFMHGPTFMGNPLACAVAVASIDLLLDSPWQARLDAIATQLHSDLAPCADLPGVVNVRVLGGIGVVELAQSVDMALAQRFFVEHGVWIRPFGRLLYLMPPYVIESAELSRLTAAVRAWCAEYAIS